MACLFTFLVPSLPLSLIVIGHLARSEHPGCLRMAESPPDELLRCFGPYCRALKGYIYYT